MLRGQGKNNTGNSCLFIRSAISIPPHSHRKTLTPVLNRLDQALGPGYSDLPSRAIPFRKYAAEGCRPSRRIPAVSGLSVLTSAHKSYQPFCKLIAGCLVCPLCFCSKSSIALLTLLSLTSEYLSVIFKDLWPSTLPITGNSTPEFTNQDAAVRRSE
jgi:hypothetical protein